METAEFWAIVGIGVAIVIAFITHICKQYEKMNNLSERLTKLETIYDLEFSKGVRANRSYLPKSEEKKEEKE